MIFCIYIDHGIFNFRSNVVQFHYRIFPDFILEVETCAIVIVCSGTPEIWCQAWAFFYHWYSIDIVTTQETIDLAKLYIKVLAFNYYSVNIRFLYTRCHNFGMTNGIVAQLLELMIRNIYFNLAFSYDMTGLKQLFGLLECVIDIQVDLVCIGKVWAWEWNLKFNSFSRRYIKFWNNSFFNNFSIYWQVPIHDICIKTAEEIFIINIYFSILDIGCTCPYRLMEIFDLITLRIRHTIRTD